MSALQRLFRKYTRKNISPAEKGMVDAWYDSFEKERTDADNMSPQLERQIRDSLWSRLSVQLQLNTIPGKALQFPHSHDTRNADAPVRRMFLRYGTAAAITGIILTIAGMVVYKVRNKPVIPQYASVRTGVGERKRIQLPDGSIIQLNAGSSIRFDKTFENPVREIFMSDGEAWYDIASDNARPFLIHTGQLTIRVLGTSFNVRTIRGIKEQTILVRQGKVQIQQMDSTLGILTAGRQLVYDTANGHYRIDDHKELAAEQLEAGWLVLDNVSFSVMRMLIRERYNLDIIDSGNKLTHAFFTASFLPNARPDDIMQVICSIHNVQFNRKDRQVYIK